MVALALTLLLASVPAPEVPDGSRTSIDLPTFLEDTGTTLLGPLTPRWDHAAVLVPAAALTVVAWHFDVQLHDFMAHRLWDPLMPGGQRLSSWTSYGGEGWVDLVVFGVTAMAGGSHGKRVALAGVTALTAVAVASEVGKHVFRMERPRVPDAQHALFSSRNVQTDAMPSGHAMTAFATATVLAREYPASTPFVYGLATLVGAARVQSSAHWPSNVVVGAALGTLFGWASVDVTRKVTLAPTSVPGGAGLAVSGTL